MGVDAEPRPARADDVAGLRSLARAAGLPDWTEAQWEAERTGTASRIWVVPGAHGLRGLLAVRAVAGELEIVQLAVAADTRRRGCARRLLGAACAAEPGVVRIHLEVRAGNRPAQAFYRALGLAPVGRRRAYYADGEDAVRWAGPAPGTAPRASRAPRG